MSAPGEGIVARLRVVALSVGVLLSGCVVGPDFHKPAPPATQRYTAEPLPQLPAVAGVAPQRLVDGRDIPAEWWGLFHSPPLDALMRRALAANPDLQAADAALRVARENVRAQEGAFFPSVDAQYGATRQGVATSLASPLASGADTYTLHTAQLSVGYVPDVFGGNRRQLESLRAEADSQRAQLDAAHLTLAANLVEAVVQRASTSAQIDATVALIDLSARQLALLRREQALGQIGAGDVALQDASLAQQQAALPPLQKQLAQFADQIAVLTGTLPGEATVPAIAFDALALPQELPLSLPSTLVEQRPDIRAAEAQLHAASAQVGVAEANRLPSFSLSGGGGSSALQVSKLFGSGAGFWSLGADVTQPLFDAGTLQHRQRAAEAAYEQATAQYRSTVLVAFQNVADTLHAIDADGRALAATVGAERAATRSLEIARRQQSAGAVGVLVVLAAEQTLRQATLARIQAEAGRLIDSAALFQALGGGWWNCPSAGCG